MMRKATVIFFLSDAAKHFGDILHDVCAIEHQAELVYGTLLRSQVARFIFGIKMQSLQIQSYAVAQSAKYGETKMEIPNTVSKWH